MADPASKNILSIDAAKPKLQAAPPLVNEGRTQNPHGSDASALGIFLILIIGILIGFMGYELSKSTIHNFLYFESTDDAQIAAHSSIINAKVGGIISKVLVTDNAQVKKGDILFALDSREYINGIKQLQAEMNALNVKYQHAESEYNRGQYLFQKLETPEYINSIRQLQAEMNALDARYQFSLNDFNRIEYLYDKKALPQNRLDAAKAQVLENLGFISAKKAQLDQAKLNLEFKNAPITRLKALKAQSSESLALYWAKKAQLDQAKLNLEFTEIRAPANGMLGKIQIEPGFVIKPQQYITSFVDYRERWVVANYKETQLQNVRVGQKAEIEIDAIENKIFLGHIESISPGSGASFALIPPDNATGNFTKIVQRVAVKIDLDPESIRGYEDRLIPGISVFVKVRFRPEKNQI